MKPLFILLCLALAACGPSQKLKRSEIEGSQEERVNRAVAILKKYGPLPGPILDAYMAEDVMDNSGGMVPGPSDSYLSGVIRFPREDLAKWRNALAPMIEPPAHQRYFSPIAAPVWWPSDSAFQGCEFYAPDKLTKRMGGILALSPSDSAIYFSTF